MIASATRSEPDHESVELSTPAAPIARNPNHATTITISGAIDVLRSEQSIHNLRSLCALLTDSMGGLRPTHCMTSSDAIFRVGLRLRRDHRRTWPGQRLDGGSARTAPPHGPQAYSHFGAAAR